MGKILIFLFVLWSAASEASVSCGANLHSDMDLDEYAAALRHTEINRNSFIRAQHIILSRAQLLGLDQSIWSDFFRAVSLRSLGYDEMSSNLVSEIWRRANDPALDEENLKQAVLTLAANQDVAPAFVMLDFLNAGAPCVENMLGHYSQLISGLQIGPRQAEMVRTVLQYAQTHRGDRILEIGFGTPAVLLALTNYTSTAGIGLEVQKEWAGRNAQLKRHSVEIRSGKFPAATTVARLTSRAPFAVIYAQDVFTAAMDPRVLPAAHKLLKPGGVLIFVNDFAKAPEFSAAQAQAAGFSIVRFGEIVEIPDVWKRLMDYSTDHVDAGKLNKFILRKGQVKLHHQTSVQADGRVVSRSDYQ